jgi:phosphohistidine phosphatase
VHHADVRTLYLLRHLKSSWDEPGLSDHERPLAPRGRRAGKKLARHLRTERVAPELVLCSTSTRTRQTFEVVKAALGAPEARFLPELYAASEAALLAAAHAVEPKTRSVLLIAHNPGLEDLAVGLAARGDGDALQRLGEKFPTGAFATLVFAGGWAELEPGAGELVDLVVPRELG